MMTAYRWPVGLAISALCLAVGIVRADAQANGLGNSPNGRLGSTFAAATSVRELSDGKVLITDPRQNRVVLGDFASGSVTEVASVGHPPQFQRAYPLYQLRGDTSLMVSLDMKWGMFWTGPTPVGAMLPSDPLFQFQGDLLAGFDRAGDALVLSFPKGRREVTDSGVALFLRRNAVRTDTLEKLRGTDVFGPDKVPQLWSLAESARIAPDGAVAVVRVNPFRVDWHLPNGQWIHGPSIPGGDVPFDAQERRAFSKSMEGKLSPERLADALQRAPKVIAPYIVSTTKLFTPEGFLLVARVSNSSHLGNWYQVANRAGNVVRDILLPSNEQIRGFGPRAVYITSDDDNGRQTLVRYPWP